MASRYKPVKASRHFTRRIRYDQIDWNDRAEVVRRFEQQLRWWYVKPLERLCRQSGHNGFAVVALGCVLLDTLSQYHAGSTQSSGGTFRNFIRNKLPHLCNPPFPQPIRIWNEKTRNEGTAIDFADVLWNGFRCGILHEAHAPLYARLWGVSGVYEFVASGFATYADTGQPCPTVSVNPHNFANEVLALFRTFIADLRNPANTALWRNFKRKFLLSYGIDIGNEP